MVSRIAMHACHISSTDTTSSAVPYRFGYQFISISSSLFLFISLFSRSPNKLYNIITRWRPPPHVNNSYYHRYEDLLTDCYQCYFTQRRTILKPSIAKAIRDLQLKYSRDYCSLVGTYPECIA